MLVPFSPSAIGGSWSVSDVDNAESKKNGLAKNRDASEDCCSRIQARRAINPFLFSR
jgi:hypothetical protein